MLIILKPLEGWDIALIKRISKSLTIKIFLITSLLLILSCALTYGFIAYYVPVTYTNNISDELIKNSIKLKEQLSETTLRLCGPLIDNFVLTNQAKVEVLNESKKPVYLNTKVESGDNNFVVKSAFISATEIMENIHFTDSTSMSLSQAYQFYFSNSNEQYTLLVSGNMRSINKVTEAMTLIVPWLAIAILVISLLGALIYSRFVTRPIVKISRISTKMSKLEFDLSCEVGRKDEIGVLANSLNELSQKLSTTLEELQEANEALREDIERERDLECKRLDFFTAVSHELKTPITVIEGQLEGMLHNVGDFCDRDKYLARSMAVAKKMEVMVQEILTVSRMDSSKFTFQRKIFDFSRLVRTQVEDYTQLIVQKKLILQQNVQNDIYIIGDKLLLQKVIANLISNAAHYSEAGESVFVEAHKKEHEVEFSVLNTGAHIPEDALPRLFEAFYRVEKSRNRQTGGSGLGLYIVKRILDQHNAKYKIENDERGVRFTFILPSLER